MKILMILTLLILTNLALAQTAHIEIVEFEKSYSTVFYRDYAALKELARIHKAIGASDIHVAGHTCTLGTDAVNDELSTARANSVKKLLINYGVNPLLISTKGYGESAPIATNKNEAGRKQNRRVVATFDGLTSIQHATLLREIKNSKYLRVIHRENKKVLSDIALRNQNPKHDENAEIVVVLPDSSEIEGDEKSRSFVAEENPDEIEMFEESVDEASTEPNRSTASESSEQKLNIKMDRPKVQDPLSVSGFFGPNGDSQFYDNGLPFKSERLNLYGAGISVDYKLNFKTEVGFSLYYLPSALKQGDNTITFVEGESSDFANINMNLGVKQNVYNSGKYKVKALVAVNSHSNGGLNRTGPINVEVVNYNHLSVGLGLGAEFKISKKWTLAPELSYQLPMSLSDVESYEPILWYSGKLALVRPYSETLAFIFDYNMQYRETDVLLSSGYNSRLEFLNQSFMAGLRYVF